MKGGTRRENSSYSFYWHILLPRMVSCSFQLPEEVTVLFLEGFCHRLHLHRWDVRLVLKSCYLHSFDSTAWKICLTVVSTFGRIFSCNFDKWWVSRIKVLFLSFCRWCGNACERPMLGNTKEWVRSVNQGTPASYRLWKDTCRQLSVDHQKARTEAWSTCSRALKV